MPGLDKFNSHVMSLNQPYLQGSVVKDVIVLSVGGRTVTHRR